MRPDAVKLGVIGAAIPVILNFLALKGAPLKAYMNNVNTHGFNADNVIALIVALLLFGFLVFLGWVVVRYASEPDEHPMKVLLAAASAPAVLGGFGFTLASDSTTKVGWNVRPAMFAAAAPSHGLFISTARAQAPWETIPFRSEEGLCTEMSRRPGVLAPFLGPLTAPVQHVFYSFTYTNPQRLKQEFGNDYFPNLSRTAAAERLQLRIRHTPAGYVLSIADVRNEDDLKFWSKYKQDNKLFMTHFYIDTPEGAAQFINRTVKDESERVTVAECPAATQG